MSEIGTDKAAGETLRYGCLKGERCDCAAPGPDCDFSYQLPSQREDMRGWLARVLRAARGR